VRNAAGLFDCSHMGQIHLRGPGALAAAERLLTCPVASLRTGRVRYGLLCNEEGGIVDDVTVYRLADDELMLCVNAANIEKDWRWIVRHAGGGDVALHDRSAETALLAVQGPAAAAVLAPLCDFELAGLRRFALAEGRVAGVRVLGTRRGHHGH